MSTRQVTLYDLLYAIVSAPGMWHTEAERVWWQKVVEEARKRNVFGTSGVLTIDD